MGLFEEADGGTLYIDEIAEIPLSTQVKLLRAIEEKEITRIGDTTPKKVDVRIISSTSRNLDEMVSKDLFRKDLYFRLNPLRLKLPPLRERKEDIPLLIEYFSKVFSITNIQIPLEVFSNYNWPGNIRELENEIKRFMVLGEKEVALNNFDGNYLKLNENNSLPSKVDEYQREQIIKALKDSSGIIIKAAKLLGIPWTTLKNKIKKYNIESPN